MLVLPCNYNSDRPELTEVDKNYTALEGDSVRLICGYDLKSNPSAIVSWTNPDGEPVMNGERFTMSNGLEEVSLKIANIGKDDNGTWNCTVELPRNNHVYCGSDHERVLQSQLIVVSKLRGGVIHTCNDSQLSSHQFLPVSHKICMWQK